MNIYIKIQLLKLFVLFIAEIPAKRNFGVLSILAIKHALAHFTTEQHALLKNNPLSLLYLVFTSQRRNPLSQHNLNKCLTYYSSKFGSITDSVKT